jgi:hypothetical protein
MHLFHGHGGHGAKKGGDEHADHRRGGERR